MIDKVFVDTNVLVYAHDGASVPKHDAAVALIESIWEAGNGVLSVQVLQEFYVTVTRKVAAPAAPKTARRWVSHYLNWQVVENDGESILRAIDAHTNFKISFWDAMIVQAAIAAGAQTLYSEDLNAGQSYGSVTVINPLAG